MADTMTINSPSAMLPHEAATAVPPETPTTAGIKATDSVAAFRQAVLDKLTYMVGKDPGHARDHDWLVATALVARDHIVDRWVEATRRTYRDGRKRVYYFSLEFLIGRLLFDALGNLGITETARAALRGLEVDLDRLRALEPDAALGNGGLGRLAACFMESMATLGVPAHGYGIRYDHGIFRQALRDGWQLELPEDWLSSGNPWEFERPEVSYTIGFGGTVETIESDDGTTRYRWDPAETVNAVAFDTPIAGWRGRHVNTLRLWSARATDPLRLDDFNRGDHVGALADRVRLEAISRVLYPSDDTAAGHELRLRQEFFFASASLQDLLRRHKAAARRARHARRPRGDPAERHAPGHRRARADAPAGRRARHAVGARLEHHDVDLQLHEPHAAAGSSRDLARRAHREPAAAAHADHLSHQRAASRCRSATPATTTTRSCRRSP